MSGERKTAKALADAARDADEALQATPVGQIVEPCPKAKPSVWIVDDRGDPATTTATVKNRLEVSARDTNDIRGGENDELPVGWRQSSNDRRNFKVQVFDPCSEDNDIEVDIETLRPDRRRFSPPRTLRVTLRKVVGTANLYRSRYLRLVVDETDRSNNPQQTVLTDVDPTDESVEILGQIVRVTYTGSSGNAAAEASVGSQDRAFFRLAVQVLRDKPAGAPLLSTTAATTHVKTALRRKYAQVNLSPQLLFCREIDPVANLVAISDPGGKSASGQDSGGAPSMISFTIRSTSPGGANFTQDVGPYYQMAGDTPSQTANALAVLIRGNPASAPIPSQGTPKPQIGPPAPFIVITNQNPALENLNDQPGAGCSCDLIIIDPGGGRVTIESLKSTDAKQKATVPNMDLNNFDPGVLLDTSVGSIDMRALMHAYDSGLDHIDVFVIGKFAIARKDWQIFGKTVVPGEDRPLGNKAQPYATRSVFVIASELRAWPDPRKGDSSTLSHECGHALLDARHAGAPSQIMLRDGDYKRFSDLAVPFDVPNEKIVQEPRMRERGAITLVPFP